MRKNVRPFVNSLEQCLASNFTMPKIHWSYVVAEEITNTFRRITQCTLKRRSQLNDIDRITSSVYRIAFVCMIHICILSSYGLLICLSKHFVMKFLSSFEFLFRFCTLKNISITQRSIEITENIIFCLMSSLVCPV